MKVTGKCHCGQITYEAEVDPVTVRACHCTHCRNFSRTVWRASIPSLPRTFKLKGGTPKIDIKTGESRVKRPRIFCPVCNTPVYSTEPEPNPSLPTCGSVGRPVNSDLDVLLDGDSRMRIKCER